MHRSYDRKIRSSISYSDGNTPAISLTYDAGNVTNSKGGLTSISNTNSTTNYTSFDVMGNVVASNQVTGGQTYNFAYSYNVAGSLSSETYPSGRVVTTSYDAANRPSTLSGVVQGQTTNYITGSSYWPHGATWWNAYGTGLTAVAGYNTRLQPYVIWAVLNNNYSQVLFGECLNWGSGNSHPECPAAWADGSNNGTLQKTLTYAGNVPGDYHSMPQTTQAFGYDTLNRLTWETDSGSWSRSFGYDQWGNMWVSGNSGVPLAGNTPSSNVYNAANNQINGQQYDAAGNHTSANGNALGYDAENHIVSVTEAPAFGGGSETIAYDGNGQRVQKTVSGGSTTAYVYDAFGQLAAEYSNAAGNVPPCTTCYLSYDHLGNVRLVTDQNANVISRHDYLPFGEEIPGGVAGRSSQYGAPDYVNPRFTGQMRDSEMGLDYFNGRYFGSAIGRFTSPDPMNAGADMTDPQTWNGYSYVRNSPMSAVDPSGMWCSAAVGGGDTPCNAGNTGAGGGGYNEFDLMQIPVVVGYVATLDGGLFQPVYGPPLVLAPAPGIAAGSGFSYSVTHTESSSPPQNPTAPVAPKTGAQTPQQIQQACINGWYQSPIGKVDDFLSIGGLTWSPNAKENWKEILTLGAAKYLGLGSLAFGANKFNTQTITTLTKTTVIPSSAGAGLTTGLHFIGKVGSVATVVATAGDIMARGTCAMASDPALANAALQSIP